MFLNFWLSFTERNQKGKQNKKFKMVCEKCEKKLKHVATPDPWKMAGKVTISLELPAA